MEPETIEIKVSEYYDQPKYYGDMPEAVFNALEAAFISGAETCHSAKDGVRNDVNEL